MSIYALQIYRNKSRQIISGPQKQRPHYAPAQGMQNVFYQFI